VAVWLHFIGSKYYSISKFIKEAKNLGATRRVSLKILKKMNFGDRVVVSQWDGNKTIVFGYFTIRTIGGITPDITDKIREKCGAVCISFGGEVVTRGCGTYVTGACYSTSASIGEICEVIEEVAGENAKLPLVVEGPFTPFPTDQIPYKFVYLLKVPHRQGFRKFNWEEFVKDVRNWKKSKRYKYPALTKQYYADQDEEGEAVEGAIRETAEYSLKK